MVLVLATTLGLVVWVVLWAIGWKSIDAFMITTVIIMLAATAKILAPYLPNRE
jgi:hypothetical protein